MIPPPPQESRAWPICLVLFPHFSSAQLPVDPEASLSTTHMAPHDPLHVRHSRASGPGSQPPLHPYPSPRSLGQDTSQGWPDGMDGGRLRHGSSQAGYLAWVLCVVNLPGLLLALSQQLGCSQEWGHSLCLQPGCLADLPKAVGITGISTHSAELQGGSSSWPPGAGEGVAKDGTCQNTVSPLLWSRRLRHPIYSKEN